MASKKNKDVVIHYNGVDISFSGRFKETVFGKSVIEYYFPKDFTGTISEKLDPFNEYTSNNRGYRGPDFSEDIDVLAAGCSVTYGIGVPEGGTWPALLSKLSGLSYAKLAKPGASVEWIVDQLFRYFEEFGHPKYVVALFPDMFRGEIAINSSVNVSRDTEMEDFLNQAVDPDYKKGIISHTTIFPDVSQKPRLAKRPFPIEDTTPPEETIYKSIRAIRKLDLYCSAVGINLIWTSWSGDILELMRTVPKEYNSDNFYDLTGISGWQSNYRSIEQFPKTIDDPEGIVDRKLSHSGWAVKKNGCTAGTTGMQDCICFADCHLPLLEEFPDTFYLGADRNIRGVGNAHIGVHKHIHIAEDLFNAIKKVGS